MIYVGVFFFIPLSLGELAPFSFMFLRLIWIFSGFLGVFFFRPILFW